MPTVHCPTCQRALNLPEAMRGSAVCCPLCRTTFPAPAEEPRSIPERLPVVQAPPRLWGAREEKSPPSPSDAAPVESPFAFDDAVEQNELSVTDRDAMRSAASWLRTFVVAACAQVLTCGCVNNVALVRVMDGSAACVLMLVVVELVALILVFSSAGAIGGGRNRGLGVMGCILTLLLSMFQLLPCLVLIPSRRGDPVPPFVSVVIALAVAGVGLIGAIRGLSILNKPEVVSYFQRRR